jgi:hypothetical protein
MLKREDDNDVDDEVKSTVPSQNCATAKLSAEESLPRLGIYSSPLISAVRCEGQEIDGQRNTY